MKDQLQQISENRDKFRRIGTGQKMIESTKLLPRSSGERGRAFMHLKQSSQNGGKQMKGAAGYTDFTE